MRGRQIGLILLLMLTASSAGTKTVFKDEIRWITLSEAEAKYQKEPRPVIIDLYTNWCYWCKVMDLKTYNNRKVADYINDNFYAVKLNAETRQPVEWGKKKFFYNEHNKVNDFALYVTRTQLVFPTTVIIPAEGEAPVTIPGYVKPADIEPVLKYFGEGIYKSQAYPDFEKRFKSKW